MVKRLNSETAAAEVTKAAQPVVDFRVVEPIDPRSAPPAKKPLPADLARALGQSK